MKIWKYCGFYVLMICLCILAGCGNKSEKTQVDNSDNDELMEVLDDDSSLATGSTGQIGFGFLDVDTDEYIYDGSDVTIPYYVENQGEDGESTACIGLVIFVNGEAQPCKIDADGKQSEEMVMHKFYLKPGERQEFNIKFVPVSGKKGEKIGIIPTTVWNPDYEPENGDIVKFGNCYQISANIPLVIDMKQDGSNNTKNSSISYDYTDIPEKVENEYDGIEVMDSYDAMDSSVSFKIETENDSNKIAVKDGKLDFTIDVYGGEQVLEKITLFIDNKPIQIEDGDYIEIQTQKGKMCQIKASIDASLVSDGSILYGMIMTTGNDYVVQDVYMTNPVFISYDNH